MKLCSAVLTLAIVCCASLAQAEDFTHKATGLKFTLPKGWTCKETKGKIEIDNADKTLAVVGGVIPQDSAKAIFADIEKFLDKLDGLDDVEVTGGPEKETVNGLVQSWYEGTATCKDDAGKEQEIEWDLTIITGGKGILFLVGIGKLDDNEEAYEKFFESIEKIEVDAE
jgi:hypothetical protein